MQSHRLIYIQPGAAAKPPMGAPCNGCGLCCLAEPCPLGVLLSRSRKGACKALRWEEETKQYRCGALAAVSPQAGSVPGLVARWRVRLVRRWIAAGDGCDCALEPTTSRTIAPP